MAALYPPWTNTAFRVVLALLLLGGVALIATPMIYVRSPHWRGQDDPIDQPVEFDHRHHVQDDGIDCLYCHNTATVSPTAGIPPTDLCMGCHAQIWNESPLIEPVRRSWFSGTPIPWNRVHDVPGFVYFNHAIHVNKGVGCFSCHGRVDEMPRVYQVAPLTMGWCLDCHRYPEQHLRPLDKITAMDWQPANQDVIGRQIAAELGVRRLTNCTTCHR